MRIIFIGRSLRTISKNKFVLNKKWDHIGALESFTTFSSNPTRKYCSASCIQSNKERGTSFASSTIINLFILRTLRGLHSKISYFTLNVINKFCFYRRHYDPMKSIVLVAQKWGSILAITMAFSFTIHKGGP